MMGIVVVVVLAAAAGTVHLGRLHLKPLGLGML
jgi:hypothetical protein